MLGLRRVAPLASVVVLAAACGDGGPPVWAPTPFLTGPPTPACLHARELVARAPGLLEQGRVDRAARALQRAEDLCPVEAPATWGQRVTALAALGRSAEAIQLADRIDRSDRASDADRAAGKAARAVAEEHGRVIAESGSRRDDPELYDPGERKRRAAADLFRDGARASRGGDAAAAKKLFLEAWTAWHPNPRALVEAGLSARALGEKAEAQRLWDRAAYDDATAALRPELPEGAPRAIGGAALAWAQSGARFAVGGDEEIAVFDAELHPVLRVPTGEGIASLAFAGGDGLLVAAAGARVRVYDAVLGTMVRELRGAAGEGGAPRLVVASPDGSVVAIAGDDATVRLWDPVAGTPPRVLRAARPVVALGWSPDGARLAWADDADRVAVADARAGGLTAVGRARGGAVRGLGFDGASLVVVTATERLRFDLEHPRRPPRGLGKAGIDRARADAASFNGGAMATEAGADTALTELSSGDSAPIATAGGEHGGLTAFALAPGAKAVAAVYRDRSVALLPARERSERRELARPSRLAAFAAAPTGKALAAASEDGRVLIWESVPVGLRAFTAAGARALSFAPDGRIVAVGKDRRIELRDVAADRPGLELEAAGRIDSLAFSADGLRLAAGTDAPSVQVFDAATRSMTRELRLEAGPVRAVRFSADGRSLLLAPREGVVLWAPETHKASRFLAYGGEPRDVVFAPESGGMAVVDKRGMLLLGKPAETTPGPTLTLSVASQALALAVAKNGSLAVAEGDRAITVRTPTGKLIQRFKAPEAALRGLAVLPQGAVAAGCDDGAIRIFNAPATGAVATLRAAPGLRTGALAGIITGAGGHLELVGPDAAAAREVLRCRLGASLYPFEVCADHYVVPGLLPMVLGGHDPAEAEP
jgi:WD40 repeat protein